MRKLEAEWSGCGGGEWWRRRREEGGDRTWRDWTAKQRSLVKLRSMVISLILHSAQSKSNQNLRFLKCFSLSFFFPSIWVFRFCNSVFRFHFEMTWANLGFISGAQYRGPWRSPPMVSNQESRFSFVLLWPERKWWFSEFNCRFYQSHFFFTKIYWDMWMLLII